MPISFLIQQCATAGLCDSDFDRIKDWITILEKAGMLLLRGVAHPALPGQTMTVVSPDGSRCRAFLGPEADALGVEELSLEMPEGEILMPVEEMAEPVDPAMMSEAAAASSSPAPNASEEAVSKPPESQS